MPADVVQALDQLEPSPVRSERMYGDPMSAFPAGRWRVYDGSVFFSAWADNESGMVVAGSWRNAWATDDEAEARAIVAQLKARGLKRWGVTTYGGADYRRRDA